MRALGIILAGGNSRKMQELTEKRAVAAMPIATSYRAIDFALSNMTNSKIKCREEEVLRSGEHRNSLLGVQIMLSNNEAEMEYVGT